MRRGSGPTRMSTSHTQPCDTSYMRVLAAGFTRAAASHLVSSLIMNLHRAIVLKHSSMELKRMFLGRLHTILGGDTDRSTQRRSLEIHLVVRRRVGLSTRTGANTPCWRQPVHSTQTTPCSRNAACWRCRTRCGQGSRLDRGGRGRTPTKHNSQTRFSSSTSLRTQGRATTPVRWRQSTPNHCRRPLRRLIRCRSSHGSRRCASSMAKMRQSREISLPARCHRWNAVTFETPVYHGAFVAGFIQQGLAAKSIRATPFAH